MNNAPFRDPLVRSDGHMLPAWQTWLNELARLVAGMTQSGTTANRPTRDLSIGRQYYDTTLGKPIYVASVNPVVWKDSQGTTV